MFFLLLPLENVYAIVSCDFRNGIGIDDFSYWGFFVTVLIVIVLWTLLPKLIKKIRNNTCKKTVALVVVVFSLCIISFYLIPLFTGVKYDFGEFLKCKIHNGELKEDLCDRLYCELPSSDFGKNCIDDYECEGFCEIENKEEIKQMFKENYADNLSCGGIFAEDLGNCFFREIELDNWYSQTSIEIEGKCSEFGKGFKECKGLNSQGISIQNGIMRVVGDCVKR